MVKKKEAKPSEKRYEIEGHSIAIIKEGEVEQLWMDGTRRKFHKSEAGYLLHDNAYVSPQTSLLDAVKLCFGKLSQKKHSH